MENVPIWHSAASAKEIFAGSNFTTFFSSSVLNFLCLLHDRTTASPGRTDVTFEPTSATLPEAL